MHPIARFVGLDLRTLRPNAKYMLVPVAIVAVPILLIYSLLLPAVDLLPGASGPYMLIPAVSFLGVLSAPQSLFSYDALGRLDTLYTALGIRRRHVVAGRYGTCALLLIALTVAGVLLAAVAALALGTAFDAGIAAALAASSLALTGILLAAELPVLFGTDPGPARTVAAIPPTLILTALFAGWAIPDARAALLSWLADADPAWLGPSAIAVLVVFGAASVWISARLYARRDL